MAEETLSELVMNLISWIESLHEKNLKYEAQVTALSKELAKTKSSNEELEARILAYQNSNSMDSNTTNTGIDMIVEQQQHHQQAQPLPQAQPQQQACAHLQQPQQQPPQPQQQQQQQQQPPIHHQHHQHQQQHHSQVLYQPMAASQSFMTQPHQYIWSGYDPTTSSVINAGQVPYYEQYAGSAQAFAQQQQ
jgi:uncharacterized protein involved in copper resistance